MRPSASPDHAGQISERTGLEFGWAPGHTGPPIIASLASDKAAAVFTDRLFSGRVGASDGRRLCSCSRPHGESPGPAGRPVGRGPRHQRQREANAMDEPLETGLGQAYCTEHRLVFSFWEVRLASIVAICGDFMPSHAYLAIGSGDCAVPVLRAAFHLTVDGRTRHFPMIPAWPAMINY